MLDAREGHANVRQEIRPEAGALTIVPRGRFQHVEFGLWPNVDVSHLPSGAKALLNSVEDLTPRAGVTGCATMRLESIFQQRSLPLLKGDVIDIRRNAVPQ